MSRVTPENVFLTGGNRGLGFEIVQQLTRLKEPPKIIFVTYRNAASAKELVAFAESNKSVHPLQFDVRDIDNYGKITDKIASVVGNKGVNLLINNAAILLENGFETVTKEEMLETFEVNTIAPTLLTRAFVPLLKKGYESSSNAIPFTWSRATVINITSIIGSITNEATTNMQGSFAYKISKCALNMATKLLSLDLKKHNILVAGIHPGWVQTEMGGSEAPLKKEESIANVISTLSTLTENHNGGFISLDGNPLEY